MKRMIFIKFGGSVITNKKYEEKINLAAINDLSKQVSEILNKNKDIRILIGNGAGSFGHIQVEKYHLNDGVKTNLQKIGVAKVQESVLRLNREVVLSLNNLDVPAFTVKPHSIIRSSNGIIKSFNIDSILNHLKNNHIPVVYGDMVSDDRKGAIVMSTDRLFYELSSLFFKEKLIIEKIIFCGSTKGVLNLNGETIREVTEKSYLGIKNVFFDNKCVDVTGGMKKKVETALKIASIGINSYIIDIKSLKDCVLNNNFSGTLIK